MSARTLADAPPPDAEAVRQILAILGQVAATQEVAPVSEAA